MGIVIKPPPIHYGTNCPACTPTLWPPGETPMYMFVYASGISDCGRSARPVPNGLTFLLQQNPLSPCHWRYQGPRYSVDFFPNLQIPANSRLTIVDDLGWFFFTGIGVQCAPEIIRFVNAQAACILMYAGAGGFCMVDWSGLLLETSVELGIDFKPKLMRESRYVDNTDYVFKVTSLYQRTNFKFKSPL